MFYEHCLLSTDATKHSFTEITDPTNILGNYLLFLLIFQSLMLNCLQCKFYYVTVPSYFAIIPRIEPSMKFEQKAKKDNR